MEETIKGIFNIEATALQNKKIKSIFYDHELFNAEKKRLFDEAIESIKLIALFNDETIHIQSYKDDMYVYEEIYVIAVELKGDKHTDRIVKLIHLLIPNPVMLVLHYENKIHLSGSISRINKNDEEKAVLEEIYQSLWLPVDSNEVVYKNAIQSFNTKKYSYHTLKDFYEDYVKTVLLSNFIAILGDYKCNATKCDIISLAQIVDAFENKNTIIKSLRKEQEQTTNFGERVALQNSVLRVIEELEDIKNQAVSLVKKYE